MRLLSSIKEAYKSVPQGLVESFFVSMALIAGFLICLVYGTSLVNPRAHPAPMAMNFLYPSVFFAAGQGLGTADPSEIPGLEDFLLHRSDHFDTAHIPDNISLAPITTPFELTHIYTLYLVGWVWRIFGVSVFSMILCSSFLSALAATALYGIFRLVLRRGYSLAGALLSISSPFVIYTTNNIRDFAKTPFVLIALWVILYLFLNKPRRRTLFLVSFILGTVMGFAMGIRQDVSMVIPPVLLFLLVAIRTKEPGYLKSTVPALLLFLLPFYILSAPVREGAALEGEQAFTHSFFIGLSPDIEERMGYGNASYEALYWTDASLFAQANVLARRRGDLSSMVNIWSAEYRQEQGEKTAPRLIDPNLYYTSKKYGEYGWLLLFDYLKTFPADIVSRAWVATVAVYSMPAEVYDTLKSVEAHYPWWLEKLFYTHGLFAEVFRYGGALFVLLFILMVSMYHFKIALGLAFLTLWCTGYASIFFDARCMAYLAFFPFVPILVACQGLHHFIAGKKLEESQEQAESCPDKVSQSEKSIFQILSEKKVLKGATFLVLLFLAVALPLLPLRLWQKHQIHTLMEKLENMEPIALATTLEEREGGRLLVRTEEPLPGLGDEDRHEPGETAWEYLAAVFHTRGEDISVTVEYDPQRHIHDSSQTVKIHGISDAGEGTVTFFFPVYEISTVASPQQLEQYLHEVDLWFWKDFLDPAKSMEEQELWKSGKYLGISFEERFKDSFAGLYRIQPREDQVYLPFFQLPEEHQAFKYFKKWELSQTFGE